MGIAQGIGESGSSQDHKPSRYKVNSGSFGQGNRNMEAGAPYRYVRKHALPSVGDRFGELTVLGVERTKSGACNIDMVRVQCSCGAEPHLVQHYNLRKGKSTRCNVCAKKKAGYWRKQYHGYADICPDQGHRRRLLDRISACINRCRNPKDGGYRNYGGRGIKVFEPWIEDRKAFLAYLVTLEGWDNPKLELDRTDVNGDYAPGNLRFITKQQNNDNRRKVLTMQLRIDDLERENADLRYRLQRAEELLHSAVGEGPAGSP